MSCGRCAPVMRCDAMSCHVTSYDALHCQIGLSVADFELLSVIGRGAYGKVFAVRHHHSGIIYAMKVSQDAVLCAVCCVLRAVRVYGIWHGHLFPVCHESKQEWMLCTLYCVLCCAVGAAHT